MPPSVRGWPPLSISWRMARLLKPKVISAEAR